MNSESAFFKTLQPRGERKGRMLQHVYIILKEFILQELDQGAALTVNELISKGIDKYKQNLGDDTAWNIYQVKLDLETRGLIRNVKSKLTGHNVIKKTSSRSSSL